MLRISIDLTYSLGIDLNMDKYHFLTIMEDKYRQLKVGSQIRDSVYDGKNVFELVRSRIISPNVEWTAPIYHPFGLDELVCVHLTNQEVTDGFLKPHSYYPFVPESMNRNEGERWFFPRETMHFTLNGVVGDHNGGESYGRGYSWKDKKFAYLIPLKDVIDQVITLGFHDTIVLGKIRLPDSTAMVTNPKDNIHEIKDKVRERIERLGYKSLEIRGCSKYDPAVLYGTNINVNHRINLDKIIGDYGIYGEFTQIPLKDISNKFFGNMLALDSFISDICELVSRGNHYSLLLDVPGIIINMKKRMDYQLERWGNDPNKRDAIMRFNKGFQLYAMVLQELKRARSSEERKKMEDTLLWQD